jgi:hypothetical protein
MSLLLFKIGILILVLFPAMSEISIKYSDSFPTISTNPERFPE